jgi:hypothetical protein
MQESLPPTTADLILASNVLRRESKMVTSEGANYDTAGVTDVSAGLLRVAEWATQLAPLMDMLHDAMERGTLPDMSSLLGSIGTAQASTHEEIPHSTFGTE